MSDSEIDTVVPATAQTSAVGVTTPRGTTFSPALFYLRPVIDSITPLAGRVGSGVTLLGAHFDGLTSIVFGGGVPATKYSYVTGGDTAINVTVPPLAKSGPIVVSNPGGSAQSPTFVVKRLAGDQPPVQDADAAATPHADAVQCARNAGPRIGAATRSVRCGAAPATRSP